MTEETYTRLREEITLTYPKDVRPAKPAENAEDLWRKYMYVVCNSGMKRA